jgi:hypothetical protein
MSDHVDQVHADMAEAMREHVRDTADMWREYEEDEDFVDRLTDEQILAGIDQNYPGGAAQFMEDSAP